MALPTGRSTTAGHPSTVVTVTAEGAAPTVGPLPGAPGGTVDSAAVVLRYQGLVYRLARTHTTRRTDADDVFQEVFETYHRKQPACEGEDHRQAWLITTTLMVARRLATTTWQRRVTPVEPGSAALESAANGLPVGADIDLYRALTGLPETYRSVIHLFYLEDQPVAAIAAALGLSPATVKMRLTRGRALLRAALGVAPTAGSRPSTPPRDIAPSQEDTHV